jgi:CheY-like chemotaxis protein
MQTHNVLVVEDDPKARVLLTAVVAGQGHSCECVEDGAAAIAKLRRSQYCAVLLDLLLPQVNGFEVLQFIRSERPQMLPRTIVVTGADEATIEHFDEDSVWTVLRKPLDIGDLVSIVHECAEQDEHDH